MKAPADVVFSVITGFSKYHKWNSWTPERKFEECDAEIQAGCKGQLKFEMKARSKSYSIPLKVAVDLSTSELHYSKADTRT